MSEFIQQVINGLSLGAIYALIALGYTMVYGILKFINFAHGEIFMLGAFSGFYIARMMGLNESSIVGALVVLLLSMSVCAVIGVTIEKLAYKPLRSASNSALRAVYLVFCSLRFCRASLSNFLRVSIRVKAP